jgi:hypothetical protein
VVVSPITMSRHPPCPPLRRGGDPSGLREFQELAGPDAATHQGERPPDERQEGSASLHRQLPVRTNRR